MARIITKELAQNIVRKLCSVDLTKKGSPHDVSGVEYGGRIIALVSIRRGSEKDKGHDHIPGNLNVSPRFAREVGICNKDLGDYIDHLAERGLVSRDSDTSACLPGGSTD